MKKLIADRFDGATNTNTNNTNDDVEVREKMDMDHDAPLKALLGLRNMNEQEQEQISSVGESSVDDRVRSGTSSNIEIRTGITTVPSSGSLTSHLLNSLSNSAPSQYPIQPRTNNTNIVSGSSSGQTSTTTSNVGGGNNLVRRKASSSTKSSIPSGMYAASDIVSDFIHGYDRTRFANNTKWATSFGRAVVGKGYTRRNSGSIDSGSLQSMNQYDSASTNSEGCFLTTYPWYDIIFLVLISIYSMYILQLSGCFFISTQRVRKPVMRGR